MAKAKLKAKDVAREAVEQLAELMGRPAESVLGIERTDDGWQVTLEILELERVPKTTDLLGCYVVELDDDGDLTQYRRARRYSRGQPDGEG